jgi:uncharacterized protein
VRRIIQAIVVAGLLATTTGAAGTSPLLDAVKRGDTQAVRTLLRTKADANAADPDGTTALHWAVQANNHEIVTALIRAGANVKAPNRYGIPPLSLAATNGSAPVIEALLKAGADPKTRTSAGEPAIMTAARTGNVDALKLLIRSGADVNSREDWFSETALMWAAAENHADAVRVLAESGAEINARSTVLEAPVLEFPRSGGPNSPLPRGGWTALMFAARHGAIDAARALADLRADLNATALPQTDVPLKPEEITSGMNGVGTTALVEAIINVHYDLAAMLLEKGADPNIVDGSGMGALYAAVDMNSLQWVQGRPAPILTDRLDGIDLVRLLLQKGANPNARLKSRPLKRHHDAGSTLNFGEGTTALIRAARTNDVAVMKALLDGGANPFLTLPEGAVEACAVLLERGVDVDAFNNAGNTALHAAVTRGDPVVAFLASRGATLTLKNKAGLTPLDLAKGAGGRGGRGGGGGRGAVVRESTVKLLEQLIRDAETKKSSARTQP